MINVTKTFLPPLEEFNVYLREIWASSFVTNQGPLARQLESNLIKALNIAHLSFVNNGTIALQIALKALNISGEVITTPFSYVATTSSIAWEGATPIFADIDEHTLTLDPHSVESRISNNTQAILATHVYGNPCDVEALEKIALKHKLRVIYDAAHCFGVKFKNKSILSYGDVSTLSFHATKLFHTIEGGAVVTADAVLAHKFNYLRNFGHSSPESFEGLGINGKASELNAAMGLCLLPRVPEFIFRRKSLTNLYDQQLPFDSGAIKKPLIRPETDYNYAYYPIIFKNEDLLNKAVLHLNKHQIFPRRYFFPSLSSLPYVNTTHTPIADSISRRVLCLPLYFELMESDALQIAEILTQAIL
jgi:dTDP-4-amino-4,6-dideoxygalactose transaminase